MNSTLLKCLIDINNKMVTIAQKNIRKENIKIGLPEFKITKECTVYEEKIIFNIKQLLKIISDPKKVYAYKYDDKCPKRPVSRVSNYPIYDDENLFK